MVEGTFLPPHVIIRLIFTLNGRFVMKKLVKRFLCIIVTLALIVPSVVITCPPIRVMAEGEEQAVCQGWGDVDLVIFDSLTCAYSSIGKPIYLIESEDSRGNRVHTPISDSGD